MFKLGTSWNSRICFDGETGTGNGGSVPNAGQKPNETPITTENKQTGFDLHATNIWDQKPPVDKTQTQPNGNQQPQQQQNNQQVDPMDGFNKYVDNLDFKFALSPEQVQDFMQKGDTKGLQTAINGSQKALYRQTMLDASKMLNTSIDKAVTKAVEAATGAFKTDKSIDFLNNAIPIAKNANVAPVAQAAFGSFLKAGKTQEEAVEGVKNFFGAIKGLKNEDFGLPKASPSSTNGRTISGQQQDNEDMVDWLAFAAK